MLDSTKVFPTHWPSTHYSAPQCSSSESEETPEALRDAVTSPGGTTAAALKVFEEGDLRGLVDQGDRRSEEAFAGIGRAVIEVAASAS